MQFLFPPNTFLSDYSQRPEVFTQNVFNSAVESMTQQSQNILAFKLINHHRIFAKPWIFTMKQFSPPIKCQGHCGPSMTPLSLTLHCQWNLWASLCTVNDTSELHSAMSMTPLSFTLHCQWHRGVWLGIVNDTVEIFYLYTVSEYPRNRNLSFGNTLYHMNKESRWVFKVMKKRGRKSRDTFLFSSLR